MWRDCGIPDNTAMSDGAHLLIPFAYSTSEGCRQALGGLTLPRLENLLVRLAKEQPDTGDEHTLSMPHERVLAREYGLSAPDGLIPWAAWQAAQSGRNTQNLPWATITPCHWHVATDHMTMSHPQALHLDAAESEAFLAAMRPYFEQDGIALEYDAPTRWLARGEIFRDLATASLDRVVGRTLDEWMPRSPQAKTVRRLQQEMQMLLYTHPVNDDRARAGLLPVNSFWVSGTGALPVASPSTPPAGLQVTHALRDAALLNDWPGWVREWQQIDAHEVAGLGKALGEGKRVSVTLCGERHAQSWSSEGQSSWGRRLAGLFARHNAAKQLQAL